MFELVDSMPQSAVIKVIGVGGGGGNAVRHMMDCDVEGVEFICANTDAQALRDVDVRVALQLGGNMTKGLGAGANPEIGRQSAIEDRDRIAEILEGADMVFILQVWVAAPVLVPPQWSPKLRATWAFLLLPLSLSHSHLKGVSACKLPMRVLSYCSNT